MTAKFTVSGTNLTISFSYTGPIASVTNIAIHAAHELYNRSKTENDPAYETLTNDQKLAILDAYIVQVFTGLAKQYYVQSVISSAQATAEIEANSGLSL